MNTYPLKKWAKEHLFAARLTIILHHTILGFLAFGAGILFFGKINLLPFYTCLVPLFLMAALVYEIGFRRKVKGHLLVHLTVTALRVAFYFLFSIQCCQLINQPVVYTYTSKAIAIAAKQDVHYDSALPNIAFEQRTFLKAKDKAFLKRNVYQIKEIITPSYSLDWYILLLYLLAIAAIFAFTFVTGYIACSLACNGAEGAAIVVLILGATGLVWTEFVIVKKITKLFKELKKERPEDF